MRKFNTTDLTRLLEDAVQMHQPPIVKGRRIKLRYAHQGGKNPPIIVIHGSQAELVPDVYKRYLMKYFIKWLKLEGTPVRLEFKTGTNPYQGVKRKDQRSEKHLASRRRHTKHLIKKFGGKKDRRK